MKRKIMIILVFSLLLMVFNINPVSAQNNVASDSIKVRVTIPVMQEMEVVEPVVINNLEALFNDQEAGDFVIIEDAGSLKVESNSKWNLEVNNLVFLSNYDVFFRVEGENRWQNISNSAGTVNGKMGSRLLNFDLKIVSRGISTSENLNNRVELGYTLAHN